MSSRLRGSDGLAMRLRTRRPRVGGDPGIGGTGLVIRFGWQRHPVRGLTPRPIALSGFAGRCRRLAIRPCGGQPCCQGAERFLGFLHGLAMAFVAELHFEQTHGDPFQPGLAYNAVDAVIESPDEVAHRIDE